MKPDALSRHSQEIELKLALPMSDPSSLAKRLARTPVLARRKATQLHLHNVYYDTPRSSCTSSVSPCESGASAARRSRNGCRPSRRWP